MKTLALKRRRDLVRRRWQYGAAGLTIFLGTLAYSASHDAYRNLDASYRRTYERLALADATVTGAGASFRDEMERSGLVAVVEERRQADVPIRVGTRAAFLGRLIGLPEERQPRLDRVDVIEGSYLDAGTPQQALVETHMVDHYDLEIGDEVEFFDGTAWRSLEVAGRVVSPEYIWPARSAQDSIPLPGSFGVLFVDGELLSRLRATLVEDQVLIGYEPDADVERADAMVRRAGRRADASSAVVQADQPSNKALQMDVLGFRQMAYAFPVLFLVAAGVATYVLLGRTVLQESEVIGTLRANGLARTALARHYLSYGLWLGGVAGALGVAAGVPLGWWMTEAYTGELGIPDTIRGLHASTVVVGLLFGLACGLLSAWAPARHAARLDPAQAMRGAMPAQAGRRALPERLLPGADRLPAHWRMVLRGIGRNRRRSLSTVLGVVLALVLILATWGLIDSVTHLTRVQYEEMQLDDAAVSFAMPVDARSVLRVSEVRGVDAAELVVGLPVSVRASGDTYATQLLAFEAGTAMRGFGGDLPADGILLGRSLRSRLGLESGDQVQLTLDSLELSLETRVRGFVDEPLGTFAYARMDALTDALAGSGRPVDLSGLTQPESAMVLARFGERLDRARVLDRLRRLEGVAAVRDTRQLELYLDQYLALYNLFILLMLGFGGMLSFALLFNTMSANLAERAAELAMMRANGMSRRQVARLVVWENVLLTLCGIPLGLLAGHWVARAMMASYSTDMWAFDLHIAPTTYVWCAAAMVAITFLSLWPGLRAVEHLDIGSIVRQRSL